MMCNACGFYCCASDQFYGCGCEHCPCSECWPDDDDDEGIDDPLYDCGAKVPHTSAVVQGK